MKNMTPQEELDALIASGTMEDLERLVDALDRWPRPTRAAVSLGLARADSAKRRGELEADIASEITRSASAPLSRGARRLFRRPARDELHDVVTQCAIRLGVNVKVPPGGTLRGRLGALSGALVDRAVRGMTPAEQQDLGVEVIGRLEPRTGAAEIARAAALPALHVVLGPAVMAKVVESVLVETATVVVGRHIARAATGATLARFPLGVALGPIAWGGGAALIAWELQKPALRKLLPAFVTLGFVALRESHR